MTGLIITEVLPEGDDRAWITLNDGLTRLVGLRPLMDQPAHQALRMRQLTRTPRVSPDGTQVVWPGGSMVDVAAIRDAPHGPLPLTLYALVPEAQRYRPLAALLRACEPPIPDYLDVKPAHIVAARFGLKPNEMDNILAGHRPADPKQVIPRLSDLALLLSGLVPDSMTSGLLRRPWPYAHRHSPQNPLLHTALGCLCAGRIDLIEAPLVYLLLAHPYPLGTVE